MATNTKTNKKNLTPRQKAIKKRKRIIIFTIEIFVLLIMLIILWGATQLDKVPRYKVNEEDIGISETVKENEVIAEYFNIALFGVDAENGSLGKGNRTDVVMIASINQKTKEVKLVSVYRDTYLNMGNDTYNKMNAAYATGGPEQALTVLNSNLDLNIKNYVTVGYQGLIDTIDALGGIMIDVQSNEVSHLNNYQISLTKVAVDDVYEPVTESGMQLLNGLQATAYCRIRYTAGDDFKRTERQRDVLTAIMVEATKSENLSKLTGIAADVAGAPHVYTSFGLEEIFELLGGIASYEIVDTSGFPFDDMRDGITNNRGSVVIPDSLEENVYELHEYLFENEEYVMSEDVKAYSKKILNEVATYK